MQQKRGAKFEFKWIYCAVFTELLCICFWDSVSLLWAILEWHKFSASLSCMTDWEKEGRQCSMLRLVYTEVMKWIASVVHAGQDWNAPDLAKRMKVEAHCGERGKVPNKERQDYSYGAPAVSLFMPLKDFPCHPFSHFYSATPFLRLGERSPTFWFLH